MTVEAGVADSTAGQSWAKLRLAKAVAVLASGSFLGQIAVIAFSPILTRVYSTEEFGLLGIFITIIGIVGCVGSLKYEMAIPLAHNHSVVRHLIIICFIILIASSAIIGCVFYAFWDDLSKLLQLGENRFVIWCIPAGILLVGLIEICQNIALLDKGYVRVARSEVVQNVASAIAQLVLAALSTFSGSIIIGQLIGKVAGVVSIAGVLRRPRTGPATTSYDEIVRAAKLYRDFPLYAAPSAFVNYASRQLPTLLLAVFFGPAVVGMYALGQRVLALPLNLMGQALSRTLLSVAPSARRDGSLTELIESVLSALLKVSIPSLCMLGLLAPELFSCVFGDNWQYAGVYIQWLIPWMIIVFVYVPLSVIIRIFGKQKAELLFQVLLAAARMLALCVGGYLIGDSTATIALFGVVSAMLNGIFVLWMLSLVGIDTRAMLVAIVREVLFSIPFLLPVLGVKVWGPQEGSVFMILGTAALSALALGLVSLVRIRAQIVGHGDNWPAAPGTAESPYPKSG